MPRYIVKHGDLYLVWSTIVDAPLTFGCTLEQIRTYWRNEYGRTALIKLDESLRVGGNAYQAIHSLADVVIGNRAGLDESELTSEQIVDYYFVKRDPKAPRPTGKPSLLRRGIE